MRHLHIAFGFIEQDGKFLMQLRDGDPRIGGAGLIGCFGGKLNPEEEPVAAFCREIAEETSFKPRIREVEQLGTVNVESDHQLEPVKVTAHVFRWQARGDGLPEVNEGKLVIMTRQEAFANLDKFTTGTRAAIKEFL